MEINDEWRYTVEQSASAWIHPLTLVVDNGRVGALTEFTELALLDLSAAFDTVDDSVLTNVMRKRFGMSGKALRWVEEYMCDGSQAVRVNSSRPYWSLGFLKDQSSIRKFLSTMRKTSARSWANTTCHHLFADDMQRLCCGKPAEVPLYGHAYWKLYRSCLYLVCGKTTPA